MKDFWCKMVEWGERKIIFKDIFGLPDSFHNGIEGFGGDEHLVAWL